jgi:hypothetical protein
MRKWFWEMLAWLLTLTFDASSFKMAETLPQEFANWRTLAQKDEVPPFVIVLRMFRDTYGVSPTTTKEAFKEQTRKQTESHGGKMYLHYKE